MYRCPYLPTQSRYMSERKLEPKDVPGTFLNLVRSPVTRLSVCHVFILVYLYIHICMYVHMYVMWKCSSLVLCSAGFFTAQLQDQWTTHSLDRSRIRRSIRQKNMWFNPNSYHSTHYVHVKSRASTPRHVNCKQPSWTCHDAVVLLSCLFPVNI